LRIFYVVVKSVAVSLAVTL